MDIKQLTGWKRTFVSGLCGLSAILLLVGLWEWVGSIPQIPLTQVLPPPSKFLPVLLTTYQFVEMVGAVHFTHFRIDCPDRAYCLGSSGTRHFRREQSDSSIYRIYGSFFYFNHCNSSRDRTDSRKSSDVC